MTTKSLNNEVFTCLLLCARFEQEELLQEHAEIVGNLETFPGNGHQILEALYAWVGKVYDWWQEESRPPDEVELAAKHPTMEADDDMGE